MKKEQMGDFTRRLASCNKGQLIVIMYDIFFAYETDAKEAFEVKNHEAYKAGIRNALDTLDTLIGALDFKYSIAKNLYQLYIFCKKQMHRAMYENRLDGIMEAEKVMTKLYQSFVEAAKQDMSGPLMGNTQQVYAGMTYGRYCLNENMIQANDNRGFLA